MNRPSLLQSVETMKCLLDSMLVLTKQDRLCHVVHATSDPFYQNWLRQLNVVQHCKIVTIDDCSRSETRVYFLERLLPNVPEALQPPLSFDVLYEAFGGKLAHWKDYINEYSELPFYQRVSTCSRSSFLVNAGGNFDSAYPYSTRSQFRSRPWISQTKLAFPSSACYP